MATDLRRGEGRQAEREVAWCGGARTRRARARPPVGEEDDRGGGPGGLGWPAGPARPHSAGPAQELSAR